MDIWTEKERQYENMDVVYLLALVSEINYMNLFCFMSYLTVESVHMCVVYFVVDIILKWTVVTNDHNTGMTVPKVAVEKK